MDGKNVNYIVMWSQVQENIHTNHLCILAFENLKSLRKEREREREFPYTKCLFLWLYYCVTLTVLTTEGFCSITTFHLIILPCVRAFLPSETVFQISAVCYSIHLLERNNNNKTIIPTPKIISALYTCYLMSGIVLRSGRQKR